MMYVQAGLFPRSGVRASNMIQNNNKRNTSDEMAAYSSDPVGAIKSALKELVTLGYLDKKMLRDKNGRFQTVEFIVRLV